MASSVATAGSQVCAAVLSEILERPLMSIFSVARGKVTKISVVTNGVAFRLHL